MALPTSARRELAALCGEDLLLDGPVHRRVYDADGYTLHRMAPDGVLLPRNAEQVQVIVRWCLRNGIPYVARGAGTGLSGGCLTMDGGVQIGLARLRRILEIDPLDRVARVEPGVVNVQLSKAAASHGLCFAPDPSSQAACTIGGNFAENSGGPHTLKYGVTLPHVLGLTMVMPDGELVRVGGRHTPGPGLDEVGVQTGGEGTLGIAVELTVRLTPLPAAVTTFLAVFETEADAARAVSAMIAAGIVPAAMEMIDRVMLRAVEEAFHFGFPLDCGAVLIVEVDGAPEALEREGQLVRQVCDRCRARELRQARDDSERASLWKARKHAFGAIGRLSPNYATQDGVVPRASVPRIVEAIAEAGRRHGIGIGTVIHAADGNIHPCILFDERDELQVQAALAACGDILMACIELEGSPTGEHGVGLEKREFLPLLFGSSDLGAMERLRDAFDPRRLCNPYKVLPGGGGCGELRVAGRQVAL
jgi:glycolate oxidase